MIITEQQVREIIFDSLQIIKDQHIVPKDFEVNENTVLIGMGGNLDSVSFVAFATDVEEKIEDKIGKEFIMRLQEIHDLNEGKDALVVKDMARLVTQLVNGAGSNVKR